MATGKDEFSFEIEEHIGIISENGDWSKELNMVSYNGHPAKYDIREWSENHTKMRKGLTFTQEEAQILKGLL